MINDIREQLDHEHEPLRTVPDSAYSPQDQKTDGRDLTRKTVASDKIYSLDANTVTSSSIVDSAVTTSKIAPNAVTLAKLATGISPSHVAKFAGTVTWSGSGTTLAPTVSGVLSTDIVMATITVKPTQAAYLVRAVPSTNTITFELSAANTSNDAQISYVVFRTAS